MRAHQLVRPGRLDPVEAPAPAEPLADGRVLVRVRAASLCGSDVPHFARGGPVSGSPPVGYPLHEICGDVEASTSAGIGPGDRVVGWASEGNGLAELVSTDGAGLARCETGMPPWQAIIAQPLACVLYAVDRLPPVDGAAVAVIGLGPIGLLFSHVLRARGAATVIGVDPVDRTEVAGRLGATHVVTGTSQEWATSSAPEDRPHVVIEAVGHQPDTLRDAISVAAFGATVYAFGIPHHHEYPVDVTALVRKNLTVIGGTTTERRRYLAAAVYHLRNHPELHDLVTHLLPASAAQEAFDRASRPRPGQLKIVLTDESDQGGTCA